MQTVEIVAYFEPFQALVAYTAEGQQLWRRHIGCFMLDPLHRPLVRVSQQEHTVIASWGRHRLLLDSQSGQIKRHIRQMHFPPVSTLRRETRRTTLRPVWLAATG